MATDFDAGPFLSQGPVDAYIVRNHAAALTCRALRADRISFKCNGEWIAQTSHENERGVDDATGAPYLQTKISVHRGDVEEVFGYACECYAYAAQGSNAAVANVFVKSDLATVKLAHLRKYFERDPISDKQPLGGQVHLSCLPPEGEPRPEVFWLKDDKEIEPRSDKNFIIAHDGALIIAIARLSDSGNYTCGARNVANHRLSQTASVTIYVDGSWSEWSHWTGSCPETCSDSPADRARPFRQIRFRQCTRPAPINGGLACQGEAEDHKICHPACSTEGHWSEWSAWSECSPVDCHHSRARKCLHPSPVRKSADAVINCSGRDAWFKNCTADACSTAKNALSAAGALDNTAAVNVAMVTGLGAAILVFVLAAVVLLSLLFRRRTCHRCSKDYETAPSSGGAGGGPFYAVLSAQPDLTQHSLYDVPPSLKSDRSRLALLAWSQQNPTDSTDRSRSSPDDQYATVEDPANEERENQRNSITSALVPSHLPRVWGRVDDRGGRLDLLDYGVSLQVSDESVEADCGVDISLSLSADRPRLSDRQTLITSAVWFGVNDAASSTLRKPVALTFQHCADLSTPSDWTFDVYAKDVRQQADAADWHIGVTVGRETLNTPIFCQMDADRVHVLIEPASTSCLLAVVGRVGVDAVDAGLKRCRLLTFVTSSTSSSLRVYCVPDLKANVQWALQQEDELGGRLAADPEQCLCIEYGRDLCLYLEDVRPKWRLKPTAGYQEIPSVHLWNPATPTLHCQFALESSADAVNRHPTDYLSGRLVVYQKGQQAQRVVVDVDTSVDWPFDIRADGADKKCLHLLPPSVKRVLSSMLNPPTENGNDWRLLAKHLSVDHYLPYFASRASPTELILTLWESRSTTDKDLKQLAKIFQNMQRKDAVEIIASILNQT